MRGHACAQSYIHARLQQLGCAVVRATLRSDFRVLINTSLLIFKFQRRSHTKSSLNITVSAITSPDSTDTKVYYQSGPGLVPVRPHNIGSPSAANVHASH